MSAIAHVARAHAPFDRDTFYVGVLVGLTLLTASTLLLSFGSFSRALAAFGLMPAH